MKYQLLLISSAKDGEKTLTETKESVLDVIKKRDGKIIDEADLGVKKLAYPMKKQETAGYVQIKIEINPEEIRKIQKDLRLNQDILKFMVLRYEEKVEPKREKRPRVKAAEKVDEKIEAKKPAVVEKPKIAETVSKVKEIAAAPKPKKTIKPSTTIMEPTRVAKKKEKIVAEIESEDDRLKQLDDKLDEILKE